jgi:putative ABC transport system substrate-binding protein
LPPPWTTRPSKLARIGYLSRGFGATPWQDAFRQGLRDLGYIEGQNVAIEYRGADEQDARLPELATELVRLPLDLVVAETLIAAIALKRASDTMPIIFVYGGDPVGQGVVASLAQPGGNITGLAGLAPETSGRRLELLQGTVPPGTLVALVTTPSNPVTGSAYRDAEAAARAIGVPIMSLPVQGPDDWDRAFEVVSSARPGALLTLCDPLTPSRREGVVAFGDRTRLPTMLETREYVDDGGLMSYGPSIASIFRRAATYVDKILKGTKPSELPVEQPTAFEFVVNLRTARTLGLSIPQSVLAQATELIQ